MKGWLIAAVVAVVLIVIVVVAWPRWVQVEFFVHNGLQATVEVKVERRTPRPLTQERPMRATDRWVVRYRFTKGEMDEEHVISVTVSRRGAILLAREFRGEEIYGKELIILPDDIKIREP